MLLEILGRRRLPLVSTLRTHLLLIERSWISNLRLFTQETLQLIRYRVRISLILLLLLHHLLLEVRLLHLSFLVLFVLQVHLWLLVLGLILLSLLLFFQLFQEVVIFEDGTVILRITTTLKFPVLFCYSSK